MRSFPPLLGLKGLTKRIFEHFGYTISKSSAKNYPNKESDAHRFWVPPGHFYSPYPDLDEVNKNAERIFDVNKEILDIDLRLDQQREWLRKITELYPSMINFPKEKSSGLRYYTDNSNYGIGDAITLNAMLRIIQPKKVIEIGSGYSSALILDTIDNDLNYELRLTCIDPFPERLHDLLRPEDSERIDIISSAVQDLDPVFFNQLDDGDILFVDSTHVSKVGSDVNYILFEVFPRLNPGVYIHIHDIFYPFEYPSIWVFEGRVWHENYLVRAFLQNNASYQIEFFFDMVRNFEHTFLEKHMPRSLDVPGDNLWLRKITSS